MRQIQMYLGLESLLPIRVTFISGWIAPRSTWLTMRVLCPGRMLAMPGRPHPYRTVLNETFFTGTSPYFSAAQADVIMQGAVRANSGTWELQVSSKLQASPTIVTDAYIELDANYKVLRHRIVGR